MSYVRSGEGVNGPALAHRSGRPQQESHGLLSRWFSFRGPEQVTSTSQPRPDRPTYNIADYLPPPLEDRTIQKIVDEVKEHLHNHVEFFYISSASDTSTAHTHTPGEAPGSSQYDPPEPPAATYDISIRAEVKRVIATRVIRGIQPFDYSDEAGSLLPHEISDFLARVPNPALVKNDPVYASISSQWRVFGWYMLSHPEIREDNERVFERRLEREVQSLILNLEEQLQPYVDKSKAEEARKEHLAQLVRLVAGLGRTLSAQPASYDFAWDYVPDDLDEPDSEPQETRKDRRGKSRATDEGRRSRPRAYYEYDIRVIFPALLKKNNSPGPKSSP
ncbi:hypothetical protein G647_01347 [Cladophialophora carrionii CBS 160.54]|uniref:Uncharacterized protein n=1 Tax=Cladophialophora carrionii CBS 160.54 TaxID=1279043 RepID=V9DPV4_9EURO|nr:uncharacterized protein G647_01347 [Cladophialophora carrionii CBS 160.54]ETI28895.1 hypothetical protein G647_01347 [Cladophialophora carrionii CBS 160.54]